MKNINYQDTVKWNVNYQKKTHAYKLVLRSRLRNYLSTFKYNRICGERVPTTVDMDPREKPLDMLFQHLVDRRGWQSIISLLKERAWMEDVGWEMNIKPRKQIVPGNEDVKAMAIKSVIYYTPSSW